MLENLKQTCDALVPILSVGGIVLLGYIIVMGLVYKAGKESWLQKELQRRKTAGEPVVTRFPAPPGKEPFWKDPDLIKAGSRAFAVVCILSMYIVIMMLVIMPMVPDKKLVVKMIAVLMGYPNAMLGIGVCKSAFRLKPLKNKSLLPVILLAVAGTIFTFALLAFKLSDNYFLFWQLIILVCVSLMHSNLLGIHDGIRESEMKFLFPAVELVTTSGEVMTGLLFSGNTESDYRFIYPDGNECIVPAGQVLRIKILSA